LLVTFVRRVSRIIEDLEHAPSCVDVERLGIRRDGKRAVGPSIVLLIPRPLVPERAVGVLHQRARHLGHSVGDPADGRATRIVQCHLECGRKCITDRASTRVFKVVCRTVRVRNRALDGSHRQVISVLDGHSADLAAAVEVVEGGPT